MYNPSKYPRVVCDKEIDKVLKPTYLEIKRRYEIKFLEIGIDMYIC